MTAEWTCQQLVELVTHYLEGALDPGERLRFEAHLAGCSGCRRYVDQMRRLIAALGRLNEADLAPVQRDELLRLFRDWKQGQGAGE